MRQKHVARRETTSHCFSSAAGGVPSVSCNANKQVVGRAVEKTSPRVSPEPEMRCLARSISTRHVISVYCRLGRIYDSEKRRTCHSRGDEGGRQVLEILTSRMTNRLRLVTRRGLYAGHHSATLAATSRTRDLPVSAASLWELEPSHVRAARRTSASRFSRCSSNDGKCLLTTRRILTIYA